ncbi:hypothetical protein BCR32DRAFT_266844 [Anaeromyces robustus]|uniref:Uncharacterized protein n=1 Tax=Anaeromyces robustus TaxID=1754192 RepID=A0A1Y1XCX1_9FUNG|nr:hypothetical protein BCR32DRAFT_266844 [Anaeromyces robustus]|eukprot:ORX83620.1 hypothetical protein BCR32DRAFT_266844 [Anaeromyces robustus]
MPTIFAVNISNNYIDIQKFVEKGILSFLDIIPKTEYISIYPKYSLGLYSDKYRDSLKEGWLTNNEVENNIEFNQILNNVYQQTLNQWGEDPDIHIILISTLDNFKEKDVSSMALLNFNVKISLILIDTTSRIEYRKFNKLNLLTQKHRGYFKILNQINDFNNILQQIYRIYYKPYNCECICGNITLPLQLYPAPKEPIFPKVFSIIGFLTQSDAPLPAYKSRYLLLPFEKQKNPLNTYKVIQKSLINKNVYAIVFFSNKSYGYIHTSIDSSYMSLSVIPKLENEVEESPKYDKSFNIPILQNEISYFKADLNLIHKIIMYIPELPKTQPTVLAMVQKIHYMSLVHQYPKIVNYVISLLKNEMKRYQNNQDICKSLNEIISIIENDINATTSLSGDKVKSTPSNSLEDIQVEQNNLMNESNELVNQNNSYNNEQENNKNDNGSNEIYRDSLNNHDENIQLLNNQNINNQTQDENNLKHNQQNIDNKNFNNQKEIDNENINIQQKINNENFINQDQQINNENYINQDQQLSSNNIIFIQ